ncbi:MAG TPA: tetratricopeptide repeat protein, partial [Nitrospira sp.]|nr:tetratricopeptide repeat protein [Nitrospira sp.]
TDACTKSKVKQLVPLPLESGAPQQAISLNEQGTHAYQAGEFDEAKKYFAQTVAAAPQSGPAHYNYALALNALGETEAARRQFIEAANFAPGDKIIWDSPALSPYGNPESEEKKVAAPQNPNRRGGMGGMGGR